MAFLLRVSTFIRIAARILGVFFCPSCLAVALPAEASPATSLNFGLSSIKGITVDLRNPTLSEDILITREGGVVEAPGFRLQARDITLTRLERNGEFYYRLDAAGDLRLDYQETVFTASSLTYDFSTCSGLLRSARTAMIPWFFYAENVHLFSTGCYRLEKVSLTTSPYRVADWRVEAQDVHITPQKMLYGQHITLKFGSIPVFWLPCWKMDLNLLGESPIRYYYRFGGFQGPKVGIAYRFWQSETFTSTIRLDYRFSRGPGLTLETEYQDPVKDFFFATRTMAARDSSLNDPSERFRYRLQGICNTSFLDQSITVCASYDKISDEDVPTDYADRDWEIETAGLTQCNFRSQLNMCIVNLRTRIRANPFETVKEELPTYNIYFRPMTIGSTGIISQNEVEVGYFQFHYSNEQTKMKDYASTRIEMHHLLYRPIQVGFLQCTPSAGVVAIYYGRDPEHSSTFNIVGTFGAECSTSLYRTFGHYKHVLIPYIRYEYYTYPTTTPNQLYVFDISDGWYTLNSTKLGLRSLIYERPKECALPWLRLSGEVYTYAFINTKTVKTLVPRVYADLQWDLSPRLRWNIQTAWDFQHGRMDHYNHRIAWTASDTFAVALEYRHRSSFCWRKVEPDNLILDFFRTEKQLRHSLVSDRRDTVLFHAYCQMRHDMAIEAWMHTGWNRIREPNYLEYRFDFVHTVRSSWTMRISYQKKEDDQRVAFSFNLGVKPPSRVDLFPHRRSNL